MADLNNVLSKYLPKLFPYISDLNRTNANNALNVINAAHQACLNYPIKEKEKGSLCLHVFNQEYGILNFLKVLINNNLSEAGPLKTKAFKFLDDFLDLIEFHAVSYGVAIKDVCIMYIKCEPLALVKKAATITLSKVLELCRSKTKLANLNIKQLLDELYLQLSYRKVKSTVKEEILCLLGVISHFYPEEVIDTRASYADKLLSMYIQQLKTEIDSKASGNDQNIISGCLFGLKEYLYNFTVSYIEDEEKSLTIYTFAKRVLETSVGQSAGEIKKFGMWKAALQLLSAHAPQFGIFLYKDACSLYEIMTDFMNRSNRDLQKVGIIAIDALLKQVVEFLPSKIEEDRQNAIQVFNFFMRDFKAKLMGDPSSKQVTIAVKGYGLFAGACKSLSGEAEVKKMLVNIVQRSEHMFFSRDYNLENIITQLPSFLDSFASIISELEKVRETMLFSLEKLIIFQIDNFPKVPSTHRCFVTQGITKVFLAMQAKGDIFVGFLSKIIYQGIIRTCSHSLIAEVEGKDDEDMDKSNVLVVENPRVKIQTYKDYMYLWSSILNVVQSKEFNVLGIPLIDRQSLKEAVYDEMMKTIISLFHKLDLTVVNYHDQNNHDGSDDISDDEKFSSDPVYGLHPNNVNDCKIFINLVDFTRDFLENNSTELFEKWVYTFGKETICFSTKYPFISGFYKLVALNLNICSKIKYFKDISTATMDASQLLNKTELTNECRCSFLLFSKFAKEVAVRLQQFKDDLLASCLLVLLALPTQIIMNETRDLVPALQNTFKLGLSYLPLAEAGLETLERWSKEVPEDVMKEFYPDILPSLNQYLITLGLTDDKTSKSISKTKSRKGHKMSAKYVKAPVKNVNLEIIEESKLGKLQLRIVRFLGSIGSECNQAMLKHAFEKAEVAAVAWDFANPNHLKYPVPFVDMKPEIYFDSFLPRVLELATSSSDRQVKVAACEVLHSLVLYIVGRGSQLPESVENKFSMEELYKHLFPGLLQLACDVDQVTKQLFYPLVLQLTHWFTHRKTINTPESQAILSALWEGVTDQQNAALRDFSALCLKEYFTWTWKQSKDGCEGEKHIFKKMHSFALHPNPYKRLGASLVFNNIYKIFREETQLIRKYTLELLVQFVDSLAIAHNDDKLLGTQKLCKDALDHIERICRVKAHLFNAPDPSRRNPMCLEKADLLSTVKWLLCQCCCPQTECRHKCMDLVSKLSPHVSGFGSASEFVQMYMMNDGTACHMIFEQRLVELGVPPIEVLSPSWKTPIYWLEGLIASLECYNWALLQNIFHKDDEWFKKSVIFTAAGFLIEEIVFKNLHAVMEHFGSGVEVDSISPKEILEYNWTKCSALMKVYDLFVAIQKSTCKVLTSEFERHLWNTKFWEALILTIIDPSSIGFNMTDAEISAKLPVEMLEVIKTNMCQENPFKSFCGQYLSKNKKYSLVELIPIDFNRVDMDYIFIGSLLSGYDILIKAGIWPSDTFSSSEKDNFLEAIIDNLWNQMVYEQGSVLQKSSLSPSALYLFKRLFAIIGSLGVKPEMLLQKLLDPTPVVISGDNKITKRGLLVFSMFETEISDIICRFHQSFISLLFSNLTNDPSACISMLAKFLNTVSSTRIYRKQYGQTVIESLLKVFPTLQSWCERYPDSNILDSVLSILIKTVLIDSEVAINSSGKYSSSLFSIYLTLLKKSGTSLEFKIQVLDLLPFFLNGTDEEVQHLKSCLQNIIISHFPISSKELVIGSSPYNNYLSAVNKFLSALKLAGNEMLLEVLTLLFCKEEKHVLEAKFQACLNSFIRSLPPNKHKSLAEVPFKLANDVQLSADVQLKILDSVCLTLLRNCSLSAFVQFYVSNINSIMTVLKKKIYPFSADLEKQIVEKINAFRLMKLLYSRLEKSQLHTIDSQVVHAYVGGRPAKGNELSTAIIEIAREFKKENLTCVTGLKDMYRKLYCASFNTLIAVISCTQSELKFYHAFIFKEYPSKGEKIWENIVDSSKEYVFDIELNAPLARQKKFVSIRHHARKTSEDQQDDDQEEEEQEVESSLHLMASDNLALSSLAEDVSKFDFSTTEQTFSSKKEDALTNKGSVKSSSKSKEKKMEYIEIEADELNQHECMAPLSWLLRHLAAQGLIPSSLQDSVPPWLETIVNNLQNPSTSKSIKLFLGRLVVNNAKVLFPYAKILMKPLMDLITSGVLGSDLNYYILDVIITMLSWAPDVIPEDNLIERHGASCVLEFVIKNCCLKRRDIFRNNLEVVKTILECWKERIDIPYRVIYEKMKLADLNSKDNIIGIQLLGVVLMCNFPPYSSNHVNEDEMFLKYLVKNINNKYQEVFAATAEVIGLVLKYRKEHNSDNIVNDSFFCSVSEQLAKLKDVDQSDKFLICLFEIHPYCPEISHRFLSKLLLMQQKLHGVFLNYALSVLCSNITAIDNGYKELKTIGLFENIEHREEAIQHIILQALEKIFPDLNCNEILELLPFLVEIHSQPAVQCRLLLYKILMSLYDKYRCNDGAKEKEIVRLSKETLLKALADTDLSLRLLVDNFWSSEDRLPVNTKDRLVALMKNMYSPPTEDSFLQSATFLLLERTSHSPDYKRKIFEHPLSECNFLAYNIATSWRQRFAPMTPMFVDSMSSSLNMSMSTFNASITSGKEPFLKATLPQGGGDFSATVDVVARGGTFNWLTEKTLDTFEGWESGTDSSTSTFSPTKSHLIADKFKPTNKFQNTKKSPKANQTEKEKSTESNVWRLKRRFLKDKKPDPNVFARTEIRRQDMRKEMRKEQQKRRESEVTMYRQYRIGDLPDIQIPNSAVIAPLQALAQNDSFVAKLLFQSLLISICNCLKEDAEAYNELRSEIRQCICAVLTESKEYVPTVISFCLESLYQMGCTEIDPDTVYFASLNGNQQSIGILLLESKIMNFEPAEPQVKRLKQEREPIAESVSQWIRLAELHKSLVDYDVVHGIYTHVMRSKDVNKKALEFEAGGYYLEAIQLYNQLNNDHSLEDNATQAEIDSWNSSILACYDKLTRWSDLEEHVIMQFTDSDHPDLHRVWEDAYFRDYCLPYMIRSKLKCLLEGHTDSPKKNKGKSLLSFIDESQKNEEHKSHLEEYYTEELALLYIIQDEFDAARHYSSSCFQKFLKDWKELSPLAVTMQQSKLQDLQKYVELKEFLDIVKEGDSHLVQSVVQNWKRRQASVLDSLRIWEDVYSNRFLYLKKLENNLNLARSSKQNSSERLSGSLYDSQVMDTGAEDMSSFFFENRAVFQMAYADYCTLHGNIPVATKYLKKISNHIQELSSMDQLKFIEVYCHSKHQLSLKLRGEEKLKAILNSCENLEKFKKIQDTSITQKMLQSEAFMLLAEVFMNAEVEMVSIDDRFRSKIVEITGCTKERKVISSLHTKSFTLLKDAVAFSVENFSGKEAKLEEKEKVTAAHMALANFCNERLREQETEDPDTYVSSEDGLEHEYPKILIESLLSALRYGDSEASQLFPRLLQIIESYPEFLPIFKQKTSSVPCWMFIAWIDQMIALLDKPVGEGVREIIRNIVHQYPNAIVFPFHLSYESYSFPNTPCGKKCKEFVERTKAVLEQKLMINDFLDALHHLSVPHVMFKDYMEKITRCFNEQKKDEILQVFHKMMADMFTTNESSRSRRVPIGPLQKQFAEKYVVDIERTCGKDGKKLVGATAEQMHRIFKSLREISEKSRQDSRKYQNTCSLKVLSPWLLDFQPWKLNTQIEIPGQYTGKKKPLPEYHVKIAGFDEKVIIFSSITCPRRITIRGNDEKEYKIIVKCGEDLRQDSRIQQLFGVMNEIYAKDPECGRRHLKLITYQVFPLSSRLGLIECIDNSMVLSNFIRSSLSSDEEDLFQSRQTSMIAQWVGNDQNRQALYLSMYAQKNRTQCVNKFEEIGRIAPKNLLKKAFVKLSSSCEAYMKLRSQFAMSHAVICISHWLLGVGDRHLGNFLIDMTSGREIGIDFGHAFGSATQFLGIPELVPFRLTNQYLELMEPLREKGTLEATMIHALSALRRNYFVLLNIMDIFIKEPTVEWKNHAASQQRQLGNLNDECEGNFDWFPKQRVKIAMQKLKGANPCYVMLRELTLGHRKNAVFEKMKAVCLGDPKLSVRQSLNRTGLSAKEQVACLIDQATDPHVLCQTQYGWSPWM